MALVPVMFDTVKGTIVRVEEFPFPGDIVLEDGQAIYLNSAKTKGFVYDSGNNALTVIGGELYGQSGSPNGLLLVADAETGDPFIRLTSNNEKIQVTGSGGLDLSIGDVPLLADKVGFNDAAAANQAAAIPDATDEASAVSSLNLLLAYLRLRGDIDT